MPAVNLLIKPASGLCNYRCSYCFYADEMENRQQKSYGIMTDETLENVIKKALDFSEGSMSLAFQGGEPTLAGLDFFKKMCNLVDRYNVKGVQVDYALQTNGSMIDEDWCRFLKEKNFLVGLSIDGIKSTHDCFRKDAGGQDTYLKTLEAAKQMDRFGVEYNVLTVVNRRTAPKIRRIYDQYKKQGFMWQQYIACLDPLGTEAGSMDYSLTPQDYGNFLIDLFDLWQQDFWNRRSQPYIRQFENYISILLGFMPESCEQRGTCSIQNVVEADGSVYPCDFYVLDDYRLGNLNDEDFDAIYARRIEKEFVDASLNHTEECRKCRYFAICRGGCNRHRTQPGSPEGLNCFCRSYKMLFDRWYPMMVKIAEECRRQ